jgi:membrane fusion protein, multidrug efflux system
MFEPVRQTVVDRVTGIAWGLALAALMAGCDSRSGAGAASASASAPASAAASAPPGPPPAEVGVVTVAPQTLGLSTELPGRLEASRVAQVRARAAGILQKRLFVEGSEVKAGQALFKIDAAPYQAAAASAQAALARTQANLTQAAAQAERYQPLAEAKAISQQEFIAAVAAHKQAQADVAAAKAALQVAQINLSQASVTSPISGRIGRALVTEGALVGQGEATALAVVQQVNPLYVNFTQSTADVLRLRKALGSGKLSAASAAQASSVRVVLEDGSEYPRVGKLLFSDLTVDASSGQVTLRAELPNPDGLLLPGMYVKVRIEQAQVNNGMLLPQQAVTRTAQGDSVMVVSPQGKVAPRPVKVGLAQGGQWLVTEGLQAGEQVMVDGFQKLRGPGLVKAVPWSAASASAASAPASATR